MMYLGPIPRLGSVSQYGHLVLRLSDKRVVKVRTVRVRSGQYLLRQQPSRQLKPPSETENISELNYRPPAT